jgi:biopolymer transport protein ExbD
MDTRLELNVTPLIDVLLVLITILILAVPILTQATKLDLPLASPKKSPIIFEYVDIDGTGAVYWNDTLLVDEFAIRKALATIAASDERVLRITPERLAPYERVAQVLAAAQRAGVTRLTLTPVANR